jgi:hypothetical protein
MHSNCLLTVNTNSVKDFLHIYLIFTLVFILLFNNNVIINIASGGPYSGPNYYVNDTSGNDGNNGSFAYPWKTIQYAIDHTSSGNTIHIMAGVYTPAAGQIRIVNKNTAGQWYTLKNYNNDYVVIDGTNCPTAAYDDATIEIDSSTYVRITGLTIDHSARGGITSLGGVNRFIRIDNCSITNCACFAIKLAQDEGPSDNFTLEYNYVYNNFNNWSALEPPLYVSQETFSIENVDTFNINNNTFIGNRQLNIDVKGGGSHGKICYNYINTTAGYCNIVGFNVYGGSGVYLDARGKTHNISIYNNNIFGNNTGISMNTESDGHFEYIYIYNNMINMTNDNNKPINNLQAGRIPIGLANTGLSTDLFHHIYIYSNTIRTGIYNIYSLLQIGHYTIEHFNADNLQNVYIINNIFISSSSSNMNMLAMNHIAYEDGVIFVNNNSYYRTTGTLRVYWDGTTYTTSSPTKWGDEPIFTNPLFENAAIGDYHLTSSSPCKDSGNNVLAPDYDFDGITRPQGPVVDIGAFEFPSTSDTTPPQISALSLLNSNPLDTDTVLGWVNVSCTVTDNIAVSTVVLRIHNPSSSWNNVTMIKGSANKYYYWTTTAFSSVGNYTYSIRATDTNGNLATSSNLLFSMPPNWDIDNDGYITILDLVLVSNQYGSTGGQGWTREDVDNNGIINILDMSLVSNHFNEEWYI